MTVESDPTAPAPPADASCTLPAPVSRGMVTQTLAAGTPSPGSRSDTASGEQTIVSEATGDEVALLGRGDTIDRYLILALLGRGGMGVVYAAHDPELDRKVALKLLPPRSSDSAASRARLVREAQALARLAHPNVVTVHDVGVHADRIWIAMEFVAGQTLSAWARERPRGWSEVLRVLTEAARGVAAAHAAGLVHRDLKPDNVMIGADGRVRVMDFGLAHGRGSAPAEPGPGATIDPEAAPRSESAALAVRLTQVGAIQGTPAYMAPEQWQGHEADAAADQFGWSVMAWELLYGERPFVAADTVTLAALVIAGKRRPPPRGRAVPKWIRRTLERGLSPAPADRWPTMTALLAELEHGSARARARLTAGVLGGLAVVGLAALAWRHHDDARRLAACEATGAEIDAVWSDEARAAIVDRFTASGLPFAATAAEKITPVLARQAADWRSARSEVCRRVEIDGTWDADAGERALLCLDDRRTILAALLEEWTRADRAVIEKAVVVASSLPAIAACMDTDLQRRQPAPPAASRAQVVAVRVLLARADALLRVAQYDRGLAVVTEARALAEALAWPPLIAAARARECVYLTRTSKLADAEQACADAYFTALQSSAWEVASDAAAQQIFLHGKSPATRADALRWSRHAEAVAVHVGDPEELQKARRLNFTATVHQSAGEYAAARALQEQALAIYERVHGPAHIETALGLHNLASTLANMGAFAEARPLVERALAIREQALGPAHPNVGFSLGNLANIHRQLGDYDEARALHRRALAIHEAASGPEHASVAASLSDLANVYASTCEFGEAQALQRRALQIREKTLPADHADVGASLNNLAGVHEEAGEPELARPLYERSLQIAEKTLGPEHPDVAVRLNNLAATLLALKRPTEARALYTRALAIREKALGREHHRVAATLAGLAEVELADGHPAAALALLERAIAILAAQKTPLPGTAPIYFALARALVDSDRPRAIAEAERARDILVEAGGKCRQAALTEVETWLAEHRPGAVRPPGSTAG